MHYGTPTYQLIVEDIDVDQELQEESCIGRVQNLKRRDEQGLSLSDADYVWLRLHESA